MTFQYILKFEDNFDGTSLDATKWNAPSGTWIWPWTDLLGSNVSVSNGSARLKISTSSTGKPYRGCILENFAGQLTKQTSLQYGKCEVRAKLPPTNEGVVCYILLWPFDNTWPPEIDFVECNGSIANRLIFTQHWCQYTGISTDSCKRQTGYTRKAQSFNLDIDVTQWHTYTVDVTEIEIKWYVDNILKVTQPNKNPGQKWVFSSGIWAGCCRCPEDIWNGWGGCPSGTFPKHMDIDYVKIYELEQCKTPTCNYSIDEII